MAKKQGFYTQRLWPGYGGLCVTIVGNPNNIRKLYPTGIYIWAHSMPVLGPFKNWQLPKHCLQLLPYKYRKYCQVISLQHRLMGSGPSKHMRKVPPHPKSVGMRRYQWLNTYRRYLWPFFASPYKLSGFYY